MNNDTRDESGSATVDMNESDPSIPAFDWPRKVDNDVPSDVWAELSSDELHLTVLIHSVLDGRNFDSIEEIEMKVGALLGFIGVVPRSELFDHYFAAPLRLADAGLRMFTSGADDVQGHSAHTPSRAGLLPPAEAQARDAYNAASDHCLGRVPPRWEDLDPADRDMWIKFTRSNFGDIAAGGGV